ncbi:hypothetical protein FOA52_013568 [Chlamydomonas sp. UWO 241]|nr:hypothetical protein FOA52_013568 [Chlamydomonas sp. UWO 241]
MNGRAGDTPPPPPPPPPPPLPGASSGAGTSHAGSRKPSSGSGSKHAHHDSKPGGSKEEDAMRRAREKEKERALSASQVKAQHAVPATDNRLRRDTPFMATLRFKNDLPEIPCDPKMLISQADATKLSAFMLTTLEREPKRDLIMPADLGIPISLLNIERYAIPVGGAPALGPEDEALLGDANEKAALMVGGTQESIAPRGRPKALRNAEVSWLMRTTYIQADGETVRRTGNDPSKARKLDDGGGPGADAGREEQVAAIERTFESARAAPVHSKNPTLFAVEVLPLLPDFACWANKYVQAHFDNDPTEEVEALACLPPQIRRAVAERSMLKGFKLDQEKPAEGGAEKQERFMALIVPEKIDAESLHEQETRQGHAFGQRRSSTGALPPPMGLPLPGQTSCAALAASLGSTMTAEVQPGDLEGEYAWSKEYVYTIARAAKEADAPPEFFVRFRDGTASYCEMHTKLELKKRKELSGGADEAQLARPSKVVVRARPATEAEEAERAARLTRLKPV